MLKSEDEFLRQAMHLVGRINDYTLFTEKARHIVKLFAMLIVSWSVSAKAGNVCPSGYSDGYPNSEEFIYVTYQGLTRKCSEFRSDYDQTCGNGIKLGNPSNMRVLIASQEGKYYEFFGNNSTRHTKVTTDCSAVSYCITRREYTNYTTNEYANFIVPITTVEITKTPCQKVTF